MTLRSLVAVALLPVLATLAASCRAAPATPSSAAEPAGGRRPLLFELNGRWIGNGVSFSPYRDGQRPGGVLPSEAEILEDLRLVVRHWNLIRMYDSGPVAETTLRLIRRERLPMRLVLGAWIGSVAEEAGRTANRREVENAIRLANAYSDIVLAVNVGNEACVGWSGHRVGPSVIIPAIRAVRAAVRQPVTTADDFGFWTTDEARPVVAEVDFIMLHAYAAWNGRTLAEAMTWTSGIHASVVALHPGVPVIFGETGWPTRHDPTRLGPGQEGTLIKAETSIPAQEKYLRQHYAWVLATRTPTFLFEAFDEKWKGSGEDGNPNEAEKHWGVFTSDRRMKPSFAAIVRDLPEASQGVPAPAQGSGR